MEKEEEAEALACSEVEFAAIAPLNKKLSIKMILSTFIREYFSLFSITKLPKYPFRDAIG